MLLLIIELLLDTSSHSIPSLPSAQPGENRSRKLIIEASPSMPRIPSTKLAKRAHLHATTLPQQLQEDQLTSKFGLVSAPGRRSKKLGKLQSASDDEEDQKQYAAPKGMVTGGKAGASSKDKKYIDPKLSRNILRLARQQQEEIERRRWSCRTRLPPRRVLRPLLPTARPHAMVPGVRHRQPCPTTRMTRMPTSTTLEIWDDDEAEMGANGWNSYDANLEIDPSDRALLDKFEPSMVATIRNTNAYGAGAGAFGGDGNKTLADLIMEKDRGGRAAGDGPTPQQLEERRMPPGINPKVIEVYRKVGELLSATNPVPPKAFKIVPSLPAWESISTSPISRVDPARHPRGRPHLCLDMKSRPDAALLRTRPARQGARRDPGRRQSLVPDLRSDEEGHLQARCLLQRVPLPHVRVGTLTLKEAAIVSSVLAKVSIPVLHSAAARCV